VTRTRLYLETIERIFQSSNKIILEGASGSGVLPYLPLDQLLRSGNRPAAPIPSAATGTPVGQSVAPLPAQGAPQ
jgi:membrane protease subunit HflK